MFARTREAKTLAVARSAPPVPLVEICHTWTAQTRGSKKAEAVLSSQQGVQPDLSLVVWKSAIPSFQPPSRQGLTSGPSYFVLKACTISNAEDALDLFIAL